MLSRGNTDSLRAQNKITKSRVNSTLRQSLFTATFSTVASSATPRTNSIAKSNK